MSVKIFGQSDDLVEVEGDIRSEFCEVDRGAFLAFSDGTVIHAEYSDSGLWKLTRVFEGSASFSKWEATDLDSKEYSDVVTLGAGDIVGRGTVTFLWVVGGKIARRTK